LDDQKLEKIQLEIFFTFFVLQNCYYLYLGLFKGRSSYRRSLQPSRENAALQKMKILHRFLFFVGHFALLDPDPGTPLNSDPIQIRIQIQYRSESGSTTQHAVYNTISSGQTRTQGTVTHPNLFVRTECNVLLNNAKTVIPSNTR
jgi:hypothetical protein